MSTNVRSKNISVLVRAAWRATASERFRFFLFIILFTLSYSLELAIPWAIGYTLGVFVKLGFTDEAFRQGVLGIAAFMVLRLSHTILHHIARYVQNTVAYAARMYTLNGIFSALVGFPLNWHTSHHSGDNLSKLHRSAGAIDSCINTYVWQVIEGMTKVVLASVAIFTLDFWVAVNVMGMGLLTILIMIAFNKRLTEKYRQNNSFANKLNRICIDYLFNVVTVKTLGLESAARRYLVAQQDEGLYYSKKISKYNELKWGTTAVGYGLVIGSSLLIYFYGHKDLNAPFEVAQVYVLLNYLDKIFQAIGSFTGYYGGIIEASTAYEDGEAILSESAALPAVVSSGVLGPKWDQIEIKDLRFYYVQGDRPGLKDMELTIKAGDKIALVGPSGGGKSTFLKTVGGLLLPDKCSIVVDGGRNLSIQDLSRASLLVPQEPEIFSETLQYNLTMGEEFSADELKYYIELGKLDQVIAKLPNAQETDLAEKGLNLSVGEKQRVAMVRGLLRARNKQLVLLDEPTSSLDPKTEKEIFFALLEHFKDRVIITACHRLNIVPLFDKIVFIRDGAIEEVGSFAELLRKGGSFAAAWEDYQRKVPQVEGV